MILPTFLDFITKKQQRVEKFDSRELWSNQEVSRLSKIIKIHDRTNFKSRSVLTKRRKSFSYLIFLKFHSTCAGEMFWFWNAKFSNEKKNAIRVDFIKFDRITTE